MAKARDQHVARKAAVAALGRELSRRARSRCELCAAQGSLEVVEVGGSAEEEPDASWAVLLCNDCHALSVKGEGAEARHLMESVWSEVRPAQILTVRILRRIACEVEWAQDTLDSLYLDPEVEGLV